MSKFLSGLQREVKQTILVTNPHSKPVFVRYFRQRIWPFFKFPMDLEDCGGLVKMVGKDALKIRTMELLEDCEENIYRMLRKLQKTTKNTTIASYRTALKKGLFFGISS